MLDAMVAFKKKLDPNNIFAANNTYYYSEEDKLREGETPFYKENSLMRI